MRWESTNDWGIKQIISLLAKASKFAEFCEHGKESLSMHRAFCGLFK